MLIRMSIYQKEKGRQRDALWVLFKPDNLSLFPGFLLSTMCDLMHSTVCLLSPVPTLYCA